MSLDFLEQRIDAKITRGCQAGIMVPGRVKRYTPSRGMVAQNFTALSGEAPNRVKPSSCT